MGWVNACEVLSQEITRILGSVQSVEQLRRKEEEYIILELRNDMLCVASLAKRMTNVYPLSMVNSVLPQFFLSTSVFIALTAIFNRSDLHADRTALG
jgi:hypothetical protein